MVAFAHAVGYIYVNPHILNQQDEQIIDGLKSGYKIRVAQEQALYDGFRYFINEGEKKFSLPPDECFSAYSDAVLSTIHNIVQGIFDGRSSIKTYLFQIFCNKCIDLVRKNTTNKQQVNRTMPLPDLLTQLPDGARMAVEKMMDNQKLQAIRENLQTLGEKCREILLLFEDGYSDREIAEHLAYNSPAVAKTTRLRCLDKLKEKVSRLFV